MNYSSLFSNFHREVAACCQYKRLDNPFKAFAVVATIPFWIFYAALAIVRGISVFFFNCLASSVDYLESWVKETKKGAGNFAEGIIFLVTLPFIFFFRCILSIFSIVFYMIWFMAMCVSYIATLGGIRWQPFISTASYDENVTVKATANKTASNTIVLIAFILFCLTALIYIIALIAGDEDVATFASVCDWVYTLFAAIAIPITFKHAIVDSEPQPEADAVTPSTSEPSLAETETKSDFDKEFPDF